MGPSMLYAEREDHRRCDHIVFFRMLSLVGSRQRRVLSPAFSNAALRTVTSVFFDCAYKASFIFSQQIVVFMTIV